MKYFKYNFNIKIHSEQSIKIFRKYRISITEFSFCLRIQCGFGRTLTVIVIKLTIAFLTISPHSVIQFVAIYLKPVGSGAMALENCGNI